MSLLRRPRFGIRGAGVAAALAVSTLALAAPAGAAPVPAPFATSAPKAVKQLVPPGGALRAFALPATQRLYVHSRRAHGPVANNPQVYLVFWGSQWSHDPASAAPTLQAFFRGLGGTDDTWSNVLTQYCSRPPKSAGLPTATCDAKSLFIQHPSSTPLKGVWFDNASTAPSAADFGQLQFEVARAAQHFGRTSPLLNRDVQYVIASPSGAHPDGFPSYCAYHTATRIRKVPGVLTKAIGVVGWVNLPYVPDLPPQSCSAIPTSGPLDGYLVTASHEYAEAVTDLDVGLGWYGTDSGDGDEIADVCDTNDDYITLNTGTFAVESLFSNATGDCRFAR